MSPSGDRRQNLLEWDEARQIAVDIAKLPELLSRRRTPAPIAESCHSRLVLFSSEGSLRRSARNYGFAALEVLLCQHQPRISHND